MSKKPTSAPPVIDEHETFLVRLGPECRVLIERLNKRLMKEDELNGRPCPRGYSYGATVHQALLEALDRVVDDRSR